MANRIVTPALLLACFLSYCRFADAVQTDQTSLYVSGDILDTPCTIAPDSIAQTIDMGRTPPEELVRNGASRVIPFVIRLTDCRLQRTNPHLPDWQRFAVTFDGQADGNNFAVSGDGKGMALQLADEEGDVASPGVPLPKVLLHSGTQELHYTLRLVRNHQPLREGSYSSVVHFRLNYF
ncbi:fimbrial protein [Erwinia amylovora]